MLFLGLWIGFGFLLFILLLLVGGLGNGSGLMLCGLFAAAAVLAALFTIYFEVKEKLGEQNEKIERLTQLLEKFASKPEEEDEPAQK